MNGETNQSKAGYTYRYRSARSRLWLPLASVLWLGCGPSSSSGNLDAVAEELCGNGQLDAGEECDGAALRQVTCSTLGFDTGMLACSATCQFDTSACSICGNGLVELGEACDGDGGATDLCNADCTIATCGDGVVNAAAGEECDEGETATCNANCTAAACGDLVVNPAAGEDCDEGGNTATCDANCTAVACGDGTRNAAAGEVCDGRDLDGMDCERLGFMPGGTLACGDGCSAFDTSSCGSSETLRNHDGVCVDSIGCSNPQGDGGNPQTLAECFYSQLDGPLQITTVSYEISADTPAPDSLAIELYEWSGHGGPGTKVDTIALGAEDSTTGSHTVTLPEGALIDGWRFCIGIHGSHEADGFRLMKSQTQSPSGTSWLAAPTCGAEHFVQVSSLGFPGNWCIEVGVEKVEPEAP